MHLNTPLVEYSQQIYASTLEDQDCTHNIISALTELKLYLEDVLLEAKNHCSENHACNINIASIVMEIQRLSHYIHRFSANLNNLSMSQEKIYYFDNTVFSEIQNFIKYKTKFLCDMLPYKDSGVLHSDWWGKVFKQMTQRIWRSTERGIQDF